MKNCKWCGWSKIGLIIEFWNIRMKKFKYRIKDKYLEMLFYREDSEFMDFILGDKLEKCGF